MEIKLDDWQREILEDETHHIGLSKGRRIGATHLFAVKAVEWLRTHHNTHPTSQIVCSSITEDQAQLMIAFATAYAEKKYPGLIGKKGDKPTKNRLILKVKGNKRFLTAKAVGNTGNSARGFEGQVLMVDEAPFQPELFFTAARPILATTGGRIWMFGTFNGQEGYFWKNYKKSVEDKDPKARFKFWCKNTEEVLAERPISPSWTKEQREGLRIHLAEEKEDSSEMMYAQEYLGIAAKESRQFFKNDLIDAICCQDEKQRIGKLGLFYGGFDLARMGGDYFTAEILKKIEMHDGFKIIQADHFKKNMLLTTDNEKFVAEYTRKWNCELSAIDAGAGTLGVSVLDHLKEDSQYSDIKKKIIAINNRKLSERYDDGKQRLVIEDLYDNLRSLMEKRKITLFNRDDIKGSLRSIQWDIVTDQHGKKRVKIWGRDSHIVEGIIRAAILAKQKHLNLRILSI